MTDDRKPGDYEVGYGRPPRHTRFQKGGEGNRKGRVRGRKNLKTELLEELSDKVPVTENGRKRLLTKQTLIVKQMVADAAKGDARARDQLLRLLTLFDPPAAEQAADPVAQEADEQILARFKEQLLAEVKGKKG